MITILSLGGSIIAPNAVDCEYIAQFKTLIDETLAADKEARFVLVVGGGSTARRYQDAYKNAACLNSAVTFSPKEADWIGVMATRLNAQLIRAVFADAAAEPVVTDPTADFVWESRVLVAAGWKPGFSSDNDAVLLAKRFKASRVINLSNIEKVYTADPKKDPTAHPINSISWKDFRKLIGEEWTPGKNVPFDPVASKNAEESGVQVICAAGRDLANLRNLFQGKPFIGTTIG
ncbi:MAG: UMP kinase [Spirochaetaceae bacterium]|jgi:uridylate kinase|nr:UMP kinase [Spirochaetaceae bacterium]